MNTYNIELPGWVKWVAVDKNGCVFGYECKPVIINYVWSQPVEHCNRRSTIICILRDYDDWGNSLVKVEVKSEVQVVNDNELLTRVERLLEDLCYCDLRTSIGVYKAIGYTYKALEAEHKLAQPSDEETDYC